MTWRLILFGSSLIWKPFESDDDVALIGPRKYVDTSKYNYLAFLTDAKLIEKLPEIVTNNQVAGKIEKVNL